MEKITKDDMIEMSLEELLTEAYGKKGTKKRILAEKDIKKRSKTIVKRNKEKEKNG
jgi:hypothetical protein